MKKPLFSLLLFMLISFIFPATCFADRPNRSRAVDFNGNSYQICFEKAAPTKQQQFCKEAGGHLATITSKDENNFIRNLTGYKGQGHQYFVLGGSDFGHEGKWAWVTGEKWSYSNWAKGDPNNGSPASDTSQDYLYFSYKDGLWRDFYGKKYYSLVEAYICEWDGVRVTGVSISKTTLSAYTGDSGSLSASVIPGNASNKTIKWSSSNPKAVTVDQAGKLKYVSVGTSVITATSASDSSKSASCTVKVLPRAVNVSKITIPNEATAYVGYSIYPKVEISPSNATNKKISWSSSNDKTATVSGDGKITGRSKGTAIITATAADGSGAKATCKVNVGIRIRTVKLNAMEFVVEKNKTVQIKATYAPSDATNKKLLWSSANPKIATVSKDGKVKGVAKGTTTVKASTQDGSRIVIPVKITVKLPVPNFKFLTDSKLMRAGDVFTLTLVGLKPNQVKWKSSNPKTVTVNKNGKVTAVKAGTATITASLDGKDCKCKITVVNGKATKGKKIQEARAYGINGGAVLVFRSVSGAKDYAVRVRTYAGKTYTVKIPKNKTGSKAGEYDKFRRVSGSMNYLYVKKLGHNYESINPWMNRNGKIYSFKIYAKNRKGKTIATSGWLNAQLFNVEKDAPEQDVMLPGKYVTKDPEDPRGKSHGPNAHGNEVVKVADTKRFEIYNIQEKDRKVSIKWRNKVKNFVPSSYFVEWGINSGGQTKKSLSLDLSPKKTAMTVTGLKNEKEYVVTVTAKGKVGKKTVWMKAEEIVIPHTKTTRKAKLAKIRLGNPYSGEVALSEKLTKSQAEAFANYGNKGKAFKSKTKYLIWTNLRQIRTYIFTKTKTKEWRLWKDLPCGIGHSGAKTNPGIYTLRTKDWIFAWPAGNKNAGTVNPNGWNLKSSSMRTVQYVVYYDSYFCNALHTATYQIMGDKMTSGEFNTAGCIQLDRPWEKWVYDFGIDSTLVIR